MFLRSLKNNIFDSTKKKLDFFIDQAFLRSMNIEKLVFFMILGALKVLVAGILLIVLSALIKSQDPLTEIINDVRFIKFLNSFEVHSETYFNTFYHSNSLWHQGSICLRYVQTS